MAPRVILHCDLNCFFASVELLRYPALRDVPVAVCGDPESRHGIVLAKNEAAKQLGVKTAETIWQARQKAPHLITLPPHHSLYREYSRPAPAWIRCILCCGWPAVWLQTGRSSQNPPPG